MAAIVKWYNQIYKGTIEGKIVVTSIDPDTLSYKYNRIALESVNL